MSSERGVLKRLLVKACPQFLEDWFGAAGARFSNGLLKLSQYDRDHAQIGEKLDQAPGLLWKVAEGASSAQHAKAEADYAKAENDRMETELRRRTLEAKTRHECADADKAEAEAAIAKIQEMQARLVLLKQLRDEGVSVTIDSSSNLIASPAQLSESRKPIEIFEPGEVKSVRPNMIEVKCPEFSGLPSDVKITLAKWDVTTGSSIAKGESLGEISAWTSPPVTSRILSPSAGVVSSVFVSASSAINPGQTLATILTGK